MKFTIKKGSHRCKPILFGLWWDKRIIRKRVIFDFSSKYDLGNIDQFDHNKLFGIGYLWNKNDSARFGWRYDLDKSKIIISAYCHVGQVVISSGLPIHKESTVVMEDICSIYANRQYLMTITIADGQYDFSVVNWENELPVGWKSIKFYHKKNIGFPMNFYFGGNRTAPREITCEIKKF